MSTAHSLGSPCTAASALREERANLRHRTRVECRPIGAPPLDVRTTILINQRSRIQHLQLIQSLVHTALRVRAQCHMKGNDLAHSRGHGRAKCGGAAAFTLLSAQPGQSKSSFWQGRQQGKQTAQPKAGTDTACLPQRERLQARRLPHRSAPNFPLT